VGIRQWFKDLGEDLGLDGNLDKRLLKECIDSPGAYPKHEVARRAWNAGVRPAAACEDLGKQYGKSGWF